MPAHVTIVYPFVEEELLVAGRVHELRRVLSAFAPFELTLAQLAEFSATPTTAPVLYLAPEPAHPFREMTEAVMSIFPSYPPYSGAFASVVPHLTLASAIDAPLAAIREEVAPRLPIHARASEAQVMRYGDDEWRVKTRIYLGRADREYQDEDLLP